MMSCAKWLGSTLAAGSFCLLPLAQVPSPAVAQTTEVLEAPAEATDAPLTTGAEGLPQETAGTPESAILQGLDKITARVSEFEAPLGETVRFGSFEIVAYACKKTPPEEPPESTAFLEITDVRPDEPASVVFKGWMFASSPALSAVEHPVYDVWVTGCRAAQPAASPSAEDTQQEGGQPEGDTPAEKPTAQ